MSAQAGPGFDRGVRKVQAVVRQGAREAPAVLVVRIVPS